MVADGPADADGLYLASLFEGIELPHADAQHVGRMRGVPMRHIQAILGHSDRNVTEKYSHLAPETLERAMEEMFGDDEPTS